MTGFKESNGILTSGFIFPEGFIGFQGHFPSNKILPGICQIQCALSMLEKWKKTAVSLKEVVLAKFLKPVLPGEELTCECRDVASLNGSDFTVKAFVKKGEERIAEFKLKVCLADGKNEIK